MSFVKTSFIKSFSTHITLHPPDSSMNRHVVVSISSFSEHFCTELALIPYTFVFINMNFIVCFIVVTFLAQFTVVRKFPRVILHVFVESSLRVVLFLASRATVQLCLREHFYILICHLCRKYRLASFPTLEK